MKLLPIALAAVTALCAFTVQAQNAASLNAALANASRPQADREADARRKPAETLDFLGIGPGMMVVDLIASGGYYTEVLSNAVGPRG